jgi:hypothetical protein
MMKSKRFLATLVPLAADVTMFNLGRSHAADGRRYGSVMVHPHVARA